MINQLSYCSNRLEAFFWSPQLDDLMSASSLPGAVINSYYTFSCGRKALEGIEIKLLSGNDFPFLHLLHLINEFAARLLFLSRNICSLVKLTNKYMVDLTPYINGPLIAKLDDFRDSCALLGLMFHLVSTLSSLYLPSEYTKRGLIERTHLKEDSPEWKDYCAAWYQLHRSNLVFIALGIFEKSLLIWGRHSGKNLSRPLVHIAWRVAIIPFESSCRRNQLVLHNILKKVSRKEESEQGYRDNVA